MVSVIVGVIRGETAEGMSGLYYLGRICVNGTLQSIHAAGPIDNSTLSSGDEDINVQGRFALFIIRDFSVYERFILQENLTNEIELMGSNERQLDVKESDDILVYIYNTCASNDRNRTFCPWQVNFPANNDTTKSLYYDGSDDNIMATPVDHSMFNVEVNELIATKSTIESNFHLNVEVNIGNVTKPKFLAAS